MLPVACNLRKDFDDLGSCFLALDFPKTVHLCACAREENMISKDRSAPPLALDELVMMC